MPSSVSIWQVLLAILALAFGVICLGTVTENDIVRHLPCGHTFHSDYITPWYRTHHDTCPICVLCLALPELVHYRPGR
ncbi:hypothetical protein DER44DRAFT_796451 [Fusarium oxysporum]|nr:hypothetical protein DER44DRAFT_796451 [Fusarium oxysporum]